MEGSNKIKQPFILRESKLSEKESAYTVMVNSDNIPDDQFRKSSMLESINPFAKHKTLPESNKISTSKYTCLNSVPKIILEQFSKMANIYFLIIALMQTLNQISISQGKPVILLPLSVVIITNGIKDFIEDWKRKKSDDEENMRESQVYCKEKNIFISKKWHEIKLGDVIQVNKNEHFPADLVLINSSEPDGMGYTETKNLDGETNLKYKQANSKIASRIKSADDLKKFTGKLECRMPNEFIYEFDAKFFLDLEVNNERNRNDSSNDFFINLNKTSSNTETIFIEKNSFLLRGCSLKQTEYIYGFVVYVGHNTKIMKNSPNARNKLSRIENIMNFQIIIIFVLQTFLSVFGAIFYLIWTAEHKNEITHYIYLKNYSNWFLSFFYRIGTWTLIFTNLVPISLLVTLEMVKYVQGMFINWDIYMYDKSNCIAAKVQTSTLNEELGQVKFIFSDKTGTLTKNYMEFKKMSIGKYSYGVDDGKLNIYDYFILTIAPEIKKFDERGDITNFHLYDEEFNNHLKQKDHENNQNIQLFLTCLAVCHTIITDAKETTKTVYQSSSPDETALVNAARYFSYVFTGRDINNNIFLEIDKSRVIFQLMNLLEYSSERKRMSVIVKCPDKKIRLFTKGADIIIRERVTKNPDLIKETDRFLMNYAQKGLRTLMVAYKEITEKEYDEWSDEYREALSNHLEKDRLLPAIFDKIEKDLYLLGSTAIEDQLQDNVDEVLESFIRTGIKVWVLTGDKTDTAKSIAFSCRLITHEFIIFEFKEKSNLIDIRNQMIQFTEQIKSYEKISKKNLIDKDEAIHTSKEMNDMENSNSSQFKQNKSNRKFALILSIDEITRIMKNEELVELFYQLAIRCNSVLCCRVTPKQKAQMVNLIKTRQPNTTTLAIGDGANDVNMINSAHLGIGILGVEGRQAARASDYAIGQFQYLKRLLFVHGRESYRKNSFVVCYNFYKNVLFVIPQFWFGFESFFSGQTLYDPWIYQFYNIVFTCLPIIWFGIYDKEVSYTTLMNDTRYYVQGIVGKLFHSVRFWKWVIYAMLQGVFVFLFSFHSIPLAINSSGNAPDLFSNGSIAYSGIVLIVNIKILASTCTHSIISIGLFFYSVGSFFIIEYMMSKYYYFENFNNFHMVMTSPHFYLSILMLVAICLILDIAMKRIFLLFGIIIDPLEIKTENYEPKLPEITYNLNEEELKEINNKFLGSAFSQEVGQAPQIPKSLIEIY